MHHGHFVIVAALVLGGCGSSLSGATAIEGGADHAVPSDSALSSMADSGDAGPVCTPSWCTVAPTPVPYSISLSGIWGFASNDIWAVGDDALILHYDGTAWTRSMQGMFNLSNVWGASPNDVWVVGDGGTILHWDGTAWSPSPSNTNVSLGLVWGSAADNVWIAGDQGTVLHWTGTTWARAPVSIPPLMGPDGGSGSGSDAASDAGSTSGSDAASSDGGPLPADLSGVWTDGPTDVWLVADQGLIVHWDGTTSTTVPSGTTSDLGTIWGTGPTDIWAGGSCINDPKCTGSTLIHWDGTSWSKAPNFPGKWDVAQIWGFGPRDVWVVSDFGDLFHYDGTSWTKSPTPTMLSLSGIWGTDSSHVWVVGDLAILLTHAP